MDKWGLETGENGTPTDRVDVGTQEVQPAFGSKRVTEILLDVETSVSRERP
jgi:hypothetical protein